MLIHPGPCIIPAALATAELTGAPGQDFITALSAGYEVESRMLVTSSLRLKHEGSAAAHLRNSRSSITPGKLLGLDEDQLVTALALACPFARGPPKVRELVAGNDVPRTPSHATRYYSRTPSQRNLHGSETSLEGEAGFYNAFTGTTEENCLTLLPLVTERLAAPRTGKTRPGFRFWWELLHITPKIYQRQAITARS
ncbi:MAG: hypothetical protein Ct9H300mP11_02200 [Chloroflexota bacterium]|nr:MAG: hypothetical protein Ct9H300mP11_02200 [Chloroflexota bacterium]